MTDTLVPWDYWMNDWPDEPIVWTRANLKDQAPRPLTPLTQDLIQTYEPEGMIKAFSDVFGIVDREQLGRHITGFYGALYLSVPNSAILGDATPGSSAHIKFEQFFGLTRAPGWEPPAPTRTPEEEAARKARFEGEIERVAEIVPSAIEKLVDRVTSLRPDGALDEVSSARLAEWLDGLTALGADCFAILVEGANVASLAYAKAGAALTQAGLDPDGSLLTALHIGLGGNDSADMGSAVIELARAGAREPETVAALVARDGRPASDRPAPAGSFSALYADFMRRYGHRGPGELMLERNSWRGDPLALLTLVRRGAQDAVAVRDAKGDAWRLLEDRTGGEVPDDLAGLLRYSQSVMAARENAKNPVVKLFDEVRVLVGEAGRRAVAQGRAGEPLDMLFLSLDELRALLREAPVEGLDRIAERRAAYQRCLDLDLPELVQSLPEGALRKPPAAYFEGLGFLPPTDRVETGDDGAPSNEVVGIGASPGVVEGRARVMTDALDDFEPGDVLIAETVDPGWSPVLAVAGAVVLDIGGRLSHGAVVARELDIPCVVNTKSAGRAFADGQLVRVDGSAGTVTGL